MIRAWLGTVQMHENGKKVSVQRVRHSQPGAYDDLEHMLSEAFAAVEIETRAASKTLTVERLVEIAYEVTQRVDLLAFADPPVVRVLVKFVAEELGFEVQKQ